MKHAASLLFPGLVVDCLAAGAPAEVFPSLSPAGLVWEVAAVAAVAWVNLKMPRALSPDAQAV